MEMEWFAAIKQRMEWFEDQETILSQQIAKVYKTLYEDLRGELEGYAQTHFKDRNGDGVLLWTLTTAQQVSAVEALTDQFTAMVDAAETEVGTLLDDAMVDGYEDGYNTGQWELALGGISLTDLENDPLAFTRDVIKATLLMAGVAGLSYLDRLARWGTVFKEKVEQWLRAQVAGERPVPETLEGLDSMAAGLSGHVEALAADELHRSYTAGSGQSYLRYANFLQGEVWLTREDPLVCDICQEKHLEITMEQPVEDSHPRCRCWKVPILLNPEEPMTGFRPNPLNYVEFLQAIGRR